MLRPHVGPRALALLLLCPALALAQPGASLIPEDAAFAVTINSISAIRARGDKFVKEHGLRKEAGLGRGLAQMLEQFRIKKGADETKPIAFVLADPSKFTDEEKKGFLGFLNPHYLAVPVKDVGEMAGNFKLKEADLKEGKAHDIFGMEGRTYKLMRKGRYVYIGPVKRALESAPSARPLLGSLSAAQKEMLTKADVAVHISGPAFLFASPFVFPHASFALRRADARDNAQAKLFLDAMRQLRFVVGGINLDEGGKANVIAAFNTGKGGEAAKKFLTALRAGPGTSDLVGLLKGRPLAAFAAKGDGLSNVGMARALVNIFLGPAVLDKALPGKERATFVEALERMYKELKGSRAALYPNEAGSKMGRLALVGILDVGGPDKHLAEMPEVVKHLNRAAENSAGGKKWLTLSYGKKAEKLDGLDVNLLSVEAPGLTDKQKAATAEMFGPDWRKARIVVVGKKVAFLFGSNTALLQEAVTNLKKGEKGLAEDRSVAGALARLAKERKVELHLNVEGLSLVEQGKRPGPPRGLTSFALTVEPDRMQLDIVAAKSEVKPIAARFGLAE